MSKIKTREKVENIKLLDKSAVAGQRMKSAFIRSKNRAVDLMDDSQTTPSEYAGDQVEFTAENAVGDVENAALLGVRAISKIHRNVKVEGVQNMRTPPAMDAPPDLPLALEPPPPGRALNEAYPRNKVSGALKGRPPQSAIAGSNQPLALPAPKGAEHSSDISGHATERGRVLAQNMAKKRAGDARLATKALPAPGAIERTGSPSGFAAERGRVLTGKLPQQRMEGKGFSAQRARGTIQQSVRDVGQALKALPPGNAARYTGRTVKTAEHTSRAAIKTAGHSVTAAPKATQTATRAAKAAAQAARNAVKTAAETVATAARGVIAAFETLTAAIAAGGWVVMLAVVVICLIGLLVGSSFGIFFAGEDSGTGQTVPSVVREINQDYNGRLDEIKANNPYDILEMSGSRAVWRSVLAIYAVKTTTDADDPQEVATMDDSKKALLKEIFWMMNQVSYFTNTTSYEVVGLGEDGQETTTTVTETTLYITVTHKTADEAAAEYGFTTNQLEQLHELLADENNALWLSVLYGITGGDGDIVAVALSQIGNIGGEPYWSWYGFASRVEWCACFVSWCANECGYIDAGVIPKFASCASGMAWFQERGQWAGNSIEPVPGTLIFFDWNGENGQDGVPNHVGIVEKVEDGRVYTVEGNSGDGCRERSYALGHYEILGYGLVAY